MNNCLECGKETNNPKYCSRRCSAISTNKLYSKRATKRRCSVCGGKVKSYKYSKCELHRKEAKDNAIKSITVGEFRKRESVKGKHPSWANAGVRVLGRSWNKELLKLPCRKCGYSKHVELCHIRPISDFPDSALMVEVHSSENVVELCRNCHWEFDKGIITIEEILK